MTNPIINSFRVLDLYFEARNSNPQGDPDNENAPRYDTATYIGLVTPMGIKRKIRDFFAADGLKIYVQRGACFQTVNEQAAKSVGLENVALAEEDNGDKEETVDEEEASKPAKGGKTKSAKKKTMSMADGEKLREYLCKTYIDTRLFGQLVPLARSIRGPIQVEMAESLSPVEPTRAAITRVAVATEKEAEDQKGNNRMLGGLWYIPYGLYRTRIFVSPSDARSTGCTEEDYDVFKNALIHMFDADHAAGRSLSIRALYEFKLKPTKDVGNVNIGRLTEAVRVQLKDSDKPPRSYSDYAFEVHHSARSSTDYTFTTLIEPLSLWELSADAKAAE